MSLLTYTDISCEDSCGSGCSCSKETAVPSFAQDNFNKNVKLYAPVLFADESTHMDALYKFIQIKLQSILDNLSAKETELYKDWAKDYSDFSQALESANRIVSDLEEGISPNKMEVRFLFDILKEKIDWWV